MRELEFVSSRRFVVEKLGLEACIIADAEISYLRFRITGKTDR
jgi:hypothetical protein